MRFSSLITFPFTVVLLGLSQVVHAQDYGLTQRPVSGAFLNNALPQTEASTTGWSYADAFPSLSFDDPTFIVALPSSDRLLVGTQKGFIHSFVNSPGTTTKTLFLDLSAVTQGTVGSGMMGFAFHPEFGLAGSPNRNYIYVFYSYSPSPNYTPGAASDSVPSYNRLSRFTVPDVSPEPDGSPVADRNSELVLINQYDRHLWHAGGAIFFGNDGFLYLSCGDEGGNNDPYGHGNKVDSGFFCGVLRIDVDQDASRSHPIRRQPLSGAAPPPGWPATYTQNYSIPNDNPWLDAGGSVLEEFYALGFRNPHRMTYDAVTDRIWLGDVGQSTREEVNVVEKGGNYQWSFMEGAVAGAHARPNPVIGADKPPVFDYPHTNGYTCVIGGYVYRGTEFAAYLEGKYLFGDNGTARIRALSYDGSSAPQVIELCTIPHGSGEETGMSTFGLDHNHEILMCCAGPGVKIYKLTKANTGGEPPALLSQTLAFTDLTTLTPSPALIPYTVNAPLWSDNAVKTRWMSVPNDGAPYTAGEAVDFSDTGAWTFPVGTVFVKHFELPIDETNPGLRKRLETRFLVHASDGSYYGLTYKWRPDNMEADLLPGGLNEPIIITTATGTRTQTWSYPSRQDCIVCHNPNARSVLGVRTCQLNGDFPYPAPGVTDNQLRALNHAGLFGNALNEAAISSLPKSVSIQDNTASFELRVRSYLDANCAHCHRPAGVRANFDARLETPLLSQGLIRGEVFDPLGISGARLIVPSDPGKSMLSHRDSLLGTNQMPPLARNLVDAGYLSVLSQWINSIPPGYYPPGGVFITQIPVTAGNDNDYELGMKFRSSQPGIVNAIRYYRTAGETGSHVGRLWSAGGTLLATAAFTGESAGGWQLATLAAPYTLAANTTYVVSVNSNTTYAFSDQGLAIAIANGSLSTVADGANGVFNDTPGIFPTGTFHNANYFRDVLFTPFTAFQQWMVSAGLPFNASPASDTDGDGLNLVLEYAFGTDPGGDDAAPFAAAIDGEHLALTYIRNKAATDITVLAEVSGDLVNWSSNAADVDQQWQFTDGTTQQVITARDLTPAGPAAPRRFIRLRITQP